MKGTGPISSKKCYSRLFSVDWKDVLEIDELNADNSTKMYLDKINMLLNTYAPLKGIDKHKKNLDNLRLTKINTFEKQITYKFH